MATNNTYADIKNQQKADLKNVNGLYDNMVKNSDKFYKQQIKAANDYKTEQSRLQNEQAGLIEQGLNQQKEYQKQDYLKEQKGAYADWQKQSNQFNRDNVNLKYSGLSESGNIAMYTAYQNRVATARQTYTRAITDYDMKIADAKVQNNIKLAEIAYNTLQKTLELSLQGFQYKNTLLQQKLTAQNDIKDRYYTRWNDLRNHLMQQKQSVRQFNKEYNLKKKSFSSGSGGGGGYSRSYGYSSSGGSSGTPRLTKNKSKSTKANSNTKYTTNWTPIGLKGKGLKASNKLAKQIQKKGYVTAGQIAKASKGLSVKAKQLLSSAMRRK